ncbi:MAG TPA: indolepyruvate oxidoreductase subunit beta family protein [Acetobacteraceae bacterium]|nr:indolepyruvate oxidoreductase subunit beta family protein [Acetobacteraceae bacterium]
MPEGLIARPDADAAVRAITVAILAMGGEGGGVLADWIVDLAEASGYLAQSTSVAGVAQRTGATIYYIEMFPRALAEAAAAEPVFALMPAPGDVDVVVASELMEAARAVQRGLVTPDRTVLIASTNRVYAMGEKLAMAEGRADSTALLQACRDAAARLVATDMQRLAEEEGSVISAALFGALAGSAALPFPRAEFEAAVRRGGIGVDASLAAFARGFEAAAADEAVAQVCAAERDAEAVVEEGARRCAEWQDADYAATYRERLDRIRDLNGRRGDGNARLLRETARYLALWMTYEDTVRVADLKTRASRFTRVAEEVGHRPEQVLRIREFLHPRIEEVADTLPAWLGRAVLRPGVLRVVVARLCARGWVVETTSIPGFLLLRAVAGLRRWRRGTLRFAVEQERITTWLARIAATAAADYALACEIAESQRLVKGYGDTHARGWRNFQALMAAADRLAGQSDAATRLAAMRDAALADEHGHALARAMAALP